MSPRGQVQRETNKRKRASFAAEHQIGFGESVFGYGVGERDDFKRHLLFGRPDRPFTLPSTSGLCYTRVRSGGMISRGGQLPSLKGGNNAACVLQRKSDA